MYTLPFIQNGTLFKSRGEIFIRGEGCNTLGVWLPHNCMSFYKHKHHLCHHAIVTETYTVEFVAHACFSNNGDDIDNAHVYEMTCDLVEAKHLGCYSPPPLEKSRPEIWKAYQSV